MAPSWKLLYACWLLVGNDGMEQKMQAALLLRVEGLGRLAEHEGTQSILETTLLFGNIVGRCRNPLQ